MKTLRINPENIRGISRFEFPSKRISWTYLHGKLETENGFDIFSVSLPVPEYPGIYPCMVGDVEATFYLWTAKLNGNDEQHGLVVANNDLEAIEYAKKMYEKKSSVL